MKDKRIACRYAYIYLIYYLSIYLSIYLLLNVFTYHKYISPNIQIIQSEPTATNMATLNVSKSQITAATVIDREDVDGNPNGFSIHINDNQKSPSWHLRADSSKEKKVGLGWVGLGWFGLVWFLLVWFLLVWFLLVWFGFFWFGLVESRV